MFLNIFLSTAIFLAPAPINFKAETVIIDNHSYRVLFDGNKIDIEEDDNDGNKDDNPETYGAGCLFPILGGMWIWLLIWFLIKGGNETVAWIIGVGAVYLIVFGNYIYWFNRSRWKK